MARHQKFSRLKQYESTITVETVVVLARKVLDFYVFEKKLTPHCYVLHIDHEKFGYYDESHDDPSNNATVLFIYLSTKTKT